MRARALAFAFVTACGSPASHPSSDAKVAALRTTADGPSWQDAFDPRTPIAVVVRPPLILRDRLYGPLVREELKKRLLGGMFVDDDPLLQVLEAADEIVVDFAGQEDALVAVRGVRADVDPLRPHAGREPFWKRADEASPVPEFAHEGKGGGASLFVLPKRTWVLAFGAARSRARRAYVRPRNKPEPDFPAEASLVLRLEAKPLFKFVPALQRGALGAATEGLESATLSVHEGNMRGTLTYASDDAAVQGEEQTRWIVSRITEKREEAGAGKAPPAWVGLLGGATVSRTGAHVSIAVNR